METFIIKMINKIDLKLTFFVLLYRTSLFQKNISLLCCFLFSGSNFQIHLMVAEFLFQFC